MGNAIVFGNRRQGFRGSRKHPFAARICGRRCARKLLVGMHAGFCFWTGAGWSALRAFSSGIAGYVIEDGHRFHINGAGRPSAGGWIHGRNYGLVCRMCRREIKSCFERRPLHGKCALTVGIRRASMDKVGLSFHGCSCAKAIKRMADYENVRAFLKIERQEITAQIY